MYAAFKDFWRHTIFYVSSDEELSEIVNQSPSFVCILWIYKLGVTFYISYWLVNTMCCH